MKFRRSIKIVAFAAAFTAPIAASEAQYASFGCKVLLCAAATSPSWSGIPYCVPVMTQLFSILNHGGGWPSCPQGNASGLGFQPYLACPAGSSSYALQTGGGQRFGDVSSEYVPDENGPLCINPQNVSAPAYSARGSSGPCSTNASVICPGQMVSQITQRAVNPDPDFVTISPQGGTPFKFYFNLQNQ